MVVDGATVGAGATEGNDGAGCDALNSMLMILLALASSFTFVGCGFLNSEMMFFG